MTYECRIILNANFFCSLLAAWVWIRHTRRRRASRPRPQSHWRQLHPGGAQITQPVKPATHNPRAHASSKCAPEPSCL